MEYSISLSKVIENLHLETLYTPDLTDKIYVKSSHVNRPGLLLAGYLEHFDQDRIEIIGRAEDGYLRQLKEFELDRVLELFFRLRPVAVIISSLLEPVPKFLEYAEKYQVPVLRTSTRTSEFMAALIGYLSVELAPRITMHGVLVELYGEGILLIGDSGIGKSETAVELVKRGHRLIADDAVEIKKVSAISLVGNAPESIRHYVELRGIGIIDIRRIFGMSAVNMTQKIDLVVNLERWNESTVYDRLGLEQETTDILGIKIPSIRIPVSPGRNLAIILEVAAMNNRQKKMGYNTAVEFNNHILETMGLDSDL